MSDYLIDQFVSVQPGQPYRVFPFGVVVKNGVRHELTKENAAHFKLPHFKPPIKLGSHEETTPAGGQIIALEVHEDGLYAVPELTDKGAKALEEGDYRYHSPEVIWENGGYEDPTTGKIIGGPLIVGDAWLHTPHLGEAAALYSIEPKEVDMGETVNVPTSLWEKIEAYFFKKEETPAVEQPAVEATVEVPEEYKAAVVERDQYKAKIEAMEAEAAHKAEVSGLVAQLQVKEDYGSLYIEMKTAEEAATVLAGMNPEQRDWVMRNFKALTAQINESALTSEIGSSGAGAPDNPVTALDVAVNAKMTEKQISYEAAFEIVRAENPDLVKGFLGGD